MKKKMIQFMDWFEDKFSFVIDLLALIGGAFCIFLAIFIFVTLLFFNEDALDSIAIVFIPGLLGFFGIITLFALRITRSVTKKNKIDESDKELK